MRVHNWKQNAICRRIFVLLLLCGLLLPNFSQVNAATVTYEYQWIKDSAGLPTDDQWHDYFVYAEDEFDGRIYPIAIDISKTEFAKQCKYKGDHLYIGFTGNTGREMKPEDFMEYLFSRFGGQ